MPLSRFPLIVGAGVGVGGGVTLTPDPAVILLVVPEPAIGMTLNPDAAVIIFAIPIVGAPSDHYNLYMFTGSLENLGSFVATVAIGDSSEVEVVIPALVASTDYTILLRPVTNAGLETPDFSCVAQFTTDSSGDWVGLRPGKVDHVRAEAMPGGVIRVTWTYNTAFGDAKPASFNVYHDTDSDVSLAGVDANVTYNKDGKYTKDFTLSDATNYWFVVRALSAGAIESLSSDTIGPVKADSTAPSTPDPAISVKF